MTKQDYSYWNSVKSIKDYTTSVGLFRSERELIFNAVELLGKKTQEIKLLDLGCGGGRTTIPLHRVGMQVSALDIAENLILPLKKKLPNSDIRIGDAAELPWKSKSFDIVLFSHNSIDYLYPQSKREKAFSEVSRVLENRGYFIFSSHQFRLVPYNSAIFMHIVNNLPRISTLMSKGYFQEKMSTGDTVETFSATTSSIEKELRRNKFTLLQSTTFHDYDSSMIRTVLKAAMSWERYYLAQKK